MPFIAFQKLRDSVSATFRVDTRADRDILIDIAAAQESGSALTMKQLVILQSGSATTTRRRIRNLIDQGKIVRLPNAQDGRSQLYGIADQLWEMSDEVSAALRLVYDDFEKRAKASEASVRKRKTFI